MISALLKLGLNQSDAEVYICLAIKGKQRVNDLTNIFGWHKRRIYFSLSRLKTMGIVFKSSERPATFSALSLENLLNLFTEKRLEQAYAAQLKRSEVLSYWQSLTTSKNPNPNRQH
jgi:sugar-specific transcriptional regulator TrmB